MQRNQGLSLIEIVIYVAILGVIFAAVVNTLLTVFNVFTKMRVERNVSQQGTASMERIIREIRLANDIEVVGCGGGAMNELRLKTIVSPTDTTSITRRFFLNGTTFMLDEGGNQAPLTQAVRVTRAVFYIVGAPVSQQTYYVRKTGNDSNGGKSPVSSFATIGKAAGVACTGDTIYVGAGVYNESGILPANSGSAGAYISYIADTSGAKTGDAGPVVIDAVGKSDFGVFTPNGVSYIIFDGFTVMRGATHGVIVKSGARDVIIRNIITHSNGADGLAVNNADNVQFLSNLSYANGGDGIELDKGRGVTIRNNTLYLNADRGIRIEGVSINATLRNNIINQNVLGGIKLAADSVSGYSGNYNLNTDGYQISASPGPNDINANPLLADPNGADNVLGGSGYGDDKFQLSQIAAGQPNNSPALNAGSDTAFNLGLATSTTRTDSVPDDGTVDMGFHYSVSLGGQTTSSIAVSLAVRVELTIEGGSGRAGTSQKFYGTAVLRGSY